MSGTKRVLQCDVRLRGSMSRYPVTKASCCEVAAHVVSLFQQEQHGAAEYRLFLGLHKPFHYHSPASASVRHRQVGRYRRKTFSLPKDQHQLLVYRLRGTECLLVVSVSTMETFCLTLILLTWTKWRAPTNASKWRMGFNSAFKGLIYTF